TTLFRSWREQLDKLLEIKTAVPRRTLLEVEGSWTASRNRRDSLRRKLEVLGLSSKQLAALVQDKTVVETLPVRAPLAGYVSGFDKTLGQAVRAEDPLVEVHNLSRPWVQGLVSERDVGRTAIGQKVRVRFVSDPHTVYTGKVRSEE